MAPFYLVFCKRAVRTAIIFSSLLCWQPLPAFSLENDAVNQAIWLADGSLRARAINSLFAREAGDTWTITNITGDNNIVPKGEWANLRVTSPSDISKADIDIRIGTGTVTLTGQNGQLLFDTTTQNHGQRSDKIVVTPTGAGNAVLVLESGDAHGNLSLRAGSSQYGAVLLIGANADVTGDLPNTVTLTGNISSRFQHGSFNDTTGYTKDRAVTVQTNGANFVVNGNMGGSSSFITNLNAWKGNITINNVPDGTVVYGSPRGLINAYLASARNGYSIEADSGGFTLLSTGATSNIFYIDLDEKSSLKLLAPNSMLTVQKAIGAKDPVTGYGQMAKDSVLSAVGQISLDGGVINGAGTIQSTSTSITCHDPERNEQYKAGQEIEQASIIQGGKDPLTIHAHIDIAAGEISADTLISDVGDILAASVKKYDSDLDADRIYVNASQVDAYYFPRYKITANKIIAPGEQTSTDSKQTSSSGRVIAGEINIPLSDVKDRELTAAHLFVAQRDALTTNQGLSLPESSGKLTIDTGNLNLTGESPLEYHRTTDSGIEKVQTHYASRVDSDMTLTNVTSNFTTLDVGGTSELSGGKIEKGVILRTGTANFTNVSQATITDTLDVTNDFTATENGDSKVNKTLVGGTANITGGKYEGSEFTGQNDVNFTDVHTLSMDRLLKAQQNIYISGNGTANVADANAGLSFTVSGGTWEGSTLESGSTSDFENVGNINIKGSATVGSSLTLNGSTGTFASLQTGTGITQNGGSLTASELLTGTTGNASGNVTVTDGSFAFGVNSSAQSVIHGDLQSPKLKNGSFGDLKVDGAAIITGGALTGKTISADSANLSDNSLKVTDSLNIGGTFTATGNVDSNVNNAVIDGAAQISGGKFTGGNIEAASAAFSDMDTLVINKELKSTAGDINLTGSGERVIAQTAAQGRLNVSGGSYEGSGISSGGDTVFENTSSVDVDGTSAIGGNLEASGNRNMTFTELETGGGVQVSDGVFNAGKITTGGKSQGDVSLNTSSFALGTDSSDSFIHGNMTANGNGSGRFGTLTIEGSLEVNGGFLEGETLTAGNSVLRNNSQAHIDNLVLNANDLALDIEDGSILTVNTISGAYGDALINNGSLIILGDPENQKWSGSTENNIDLESGQLEADVNYVRLRTGNITGTGKGDAADDIRAHQLDAGSINITNANLFLTGLGEYASTVRNDLVISQNGNSRLGDMKVNGKVDISGGSLRARQLQTGGNASFSDVALVLSGNGMTVDPESGELLLNKSSSIGGNLNLANESSQLGDIVVDGSITSSGGEVTAGTLNAGGDVTMNGSDLNLNGLNAYPGHIGGNLTLKDNRDSSLWHIDVDGGVIGNGGTISAHVMNVGQDLTLTDTAFSLRTLEGQQSRIKGNVTLKDNRGTNLGAIDIEGNLRVNGSTLTSSGLHAGGDAFLDGVELSLNANAENPDRIDGSLTLENNANAKLGGLEVGKDFSATGGTVGSVHLAVGGSGHFSGVELELSGTGENPDSFGGDFALRDGSSANFGVLEVKGQTSSEGGAINGDSLKTGTVNLANTSTALKSGQITGAGDIAGGSLNISSMSAGQLALRNGLKAALDNLMLDGETKSIAIGSGRDEQGGTDVKVGRLDLNGGSLITGNVTTAPVAMAVRNFSHAENDNRNINGNIGVGMNGRLILGSNDTGWAPQNLVNQRAIFALAQPMRLGSGYGIHVTGEGAPTPVASQIKFDPASLFIINGSDARSYYTGEYVKSAQLSASNGAQGALSAEQGAVSAIISPGAQIYIRNPIPNTVIVALGENIKTTYADQDSRLKAGEGNPWKDLNLQYDNADKVKIERLDGEYAGQFSVTPISRVPDTPTEPEQPDNPEPGPDTPEQPGDNPGAGPDTPEQPGDYPGAGPDAPEQPQQPSRPQKPQQTHPNAHPGIHDVIENETSNGTVGNQPHHLTTDNGAGFLSHTITHDNPGEATHLVEGAVRMPIAGAVPQMLHTANRAAETAMAARTAMESLFWREEDLHARSFALWAVPLYKTSTAWSLAAGNHEYDYHGGIGGIAIGADYTLEDILRFGLSFNIGGGYAKSGGELAQTTNNMSFWGLGAYGIWSFANFALSGNVAYTSSYNKLKQDISNLPGWNELKADLQAHAISAGLQLEYRFMTDLVDIYPHIGARYHYAQVNEYSITHRGNDIITGDGFSQNIWTFPIGLKFAKDFSLESGWNIKPMLDLRIIPAAGDIEVKTNSRFTGTSTDLSLKTQTMDYVTYGGAIGFEASLKDFTLGVNYSVEAGAKSISNAIFGTLRYEF